MLTTHPGSVDQKRDLHVGGLGSRASGALAAVPDPVGDIAGPWLNGAREAARHVDDFVRTQPWAALALVALVAAAAGYSLSRVSIR